MAISKGVYSLFNGWLNKPEKEDIPDLPDIKDDYKEWEDRAKACDTVEEIDSFLDDVYKLRQAGLLAEGEFSKQNLIFKELRNNNILSDLKDKKVELENKEMSLEEATYTSGDKYYGGLPSEPSAAEYGKAIQDAAAGLDKFLKDNGIRGKHLNGGVWAKDLYEGTINGHEFRFIEAKHDLTHWAHSLEIDGKPVDLHKSNLAGNNKTSIYKVVSLLNGDLDDIVYKDVNEGLTEGMDAIKKVVYDEINADFPDLTVHDVYYDDDLVIIQAETEDGDYFKAVVRKPDDRDDDELSHDVFVAISDELDDLDDHPLVNPEIFDKLTGDQQEYVDSHDLFLKKAGNKIIMSDWSDEWEYDSIEELQKDLNYNIAQEVDEGLNESAGEGMINEEVNYYKIVDAEDEEILDVISAPSKEAAKELFLKNSLRDENSIYVLKISEKAFDKYSNMPLEEADEGDVKAIALAKHLGISVDAIDEEDGIYETPEGDFVVYTDEEADEATRDQITELFYDLGLDSFSKDFKDYILSSCIDQVAIDDFLAEERDYYETQEEDPEMVAYIDSLDEADRIGYVKDLFGDEASFAKWLVDNNALDIDAIVDEVISIDGRGPSLAFYDGDEVELDNNLFAYKVG